MSNLPPDFPSWQDLLRKLSGDTSQELWADPNIERLESGVIRIVSETALGWFTQLWLRAREAQEARTEAAYDEVMEASEPEPAPIDEAVERIVDAAEIGAQQADHQTSLPDKGPWVDVPPPRKETGAPPAVGVYIPRPERVRAPKPHATAAWIARQSAGAKMREWADGLREDVRWQVVQAIRDRVSADELASRLRARWELAGYKLQRIAVTEMSMAYNDAVLTHLANGYVVVPTIGDAAVCAECHRLLEGKVFWVSPEPIPHPTKQEYQQYVWPGKSNIGRTRADWWSCVPLHPNCRHVYVRYRGGDPYAYRVRR